jgi:nitrite reductase/ring-hydroxylating ferredoxin subunit
MSEVEAARSDEVREGAVFAAVLAGTKVALTRVNGAVQAFINKCPHLGLPLTKGKIADGVITCPFHGSSFDLCSGADKDWVTGVMGVKLPGVLTSVIAMGKTPHGLIKLTASEADGKVFVEVPS